MMDYENITQDFSCSQGMCCRATGGKCGMSETSGPRERYPICRVARFSHVSRFALFASRQASEIAQAVSDPAFRSYPFGRSTIPSTRPSNLVGPVWSMSPNRETRFHVESESRATALLRARQNVLRRQSSRLEPEPPFSL